MCFPLFKKLYGATLNTLNILIVPEWSYFLTRWQDYAEATKVTGKDKVVQLLECCDEQVCKRLHTQRWWFAHQHTRRRGDGGN